MNILAVDDNNIMRQMIGMTVKKTSDIQAQIVETGQEALLLAQKCHFDLIIIDWLMHPMSGEALLIELRKLPNHQKTPVIVLSADSSDAPRQAAKHYGATGWMVKPFHPDELCNLMRKLVCSPRLERRSET